MNQQKIVKLNKSSKGNYWTLDGKRWNGLGRLNGKIYRYNSNGTKTLLTKPSPNPKILYNNLWKIENPTKEGFKNGRYKPFNTKIEYKDDDKRKKLSLNRKHQFDIGAGINREELKLENPELVKQADIKGLSQQQIDSIMYSKIKQNLAKVDEALTMINDKTGKPYTTLPDTISPQIKLGLADLRYQTGNLGSFPKLLEAVGKGNLKTIQNENGVTANGKAINSRQAYRNKHYFYYK